MTIFSSEWAASSAMTDYGVSHAKIKVVPFGANFINVPSQRDALHSIGARSMSTCRLITIGVDWYRKGVPRAIELASILNNRGMPTELFVVGAPVPSGENLPDFVKATGFINKQSPVGEQRISQLLIQSHFHVLFSLADATPIVLSEANAHAVPNIASDVGGIGTMVRNGIGGQRFSPAAPMGDVADYVHKYMSHRNSYLQLCLNARREYDERLNWTSAGVLVKSYLEAVLSNRGVTDDRMLTANSGDYESRTDSSLGGRNSRTKIHFSD
jgi:glycosyltransferase involved in cell wall biosynthesis